MENPTQASYKCFETGDGSPTLSEGSEWMHNQKGAFGETCHIYGEALSRAVAFQPTPEVWSVGLGLGYGEMLTASSLKNFRLKSFEKVEGLRNEFLNWVLGKPGELSITHQKMASYFEQKFSISENEIRNRLLRAKENGNWKIYSDLREAELSEKFDVVFYDPYSSATNPELWEVPFLSRFLSYANPKSVFATYAAKGDLKRCLREAGFSVSPFAGFGFKRESTVAFRS